MALKVKYDVRGEPKSGERVVIDPGLYSAEITKIEEKKAKDTGNEMLEITFKITQKGKFKGQTIRTWIVYADSDGEPLESAKFKVAQFVRAVGLKDKGVIDEKVIGTEVSIKIDPDSYEGKPTSRVGHILAVDSDDDDDDDDVEEETEEEEESEEEEEEESDGDDDDDDDGEEEVELSELSLEQLKDLAREHGIKPTIKRKGEALKGAKLKKALIAKLEEALGGSDDDDDPFD